MSLPPFERHDPINWLLTEKHIGEGPTLTKSHGQCYVLKFTCQECNNEYTRIVDRETFFNSIVDKTAWEWEWIK